MRRLTTEPSSPRRWADRLVKSLDPGVREDIAHDPSSAIEVHLGLRVVEQGTLGERGNGGWCDGLSIIDAGVLFYAPTPNSRRENFTLCHEVAHYLVDADDDEETLDWMADLDDPGQVIEQVCDLVASRLLVGDDAVKVVLADVGMCGRAVADLYGRTQASREVCAIAVSDRLTCDGFVGLANMEEGVITFASRAHDGRPYPRRGDRVPSGHPLLRVREGENTTSEAWWPWPDGSRQPLYQSACRDGRWVYVVLAANDLWNVSKFHAAPPERSTITVPERRIRCPCGYAGSARGFPCPTCHKISCPQCQECDCDRKERIARDFCRGCWQSVPLEQLDDDLRCTGCR